MARAAQSPEGPLISLADHSYGDFCSRHGVTIPFDMEQIRAGRNSEVWRLSNEDGQWILKYYYQHSGDMRDRLGTEFGFLTFLYGCGIRGAPQPLGMDRTAQLGLYSLLPGKRPSQITSRHIIRAANFVREINRFRQSANAQTLPSASDACFSWQDHLHLTQRRIKQLIDVPVTIGIEKEMYAFITDQVLPLWTRLKAEFMRKKTTKELAGLIPNGARILSPSDFGFHNTLEDDDSLSFVDFEYAGWDDPAKLICDFICQPELPATQTQGMQFMEEILLGLDQPHAIKKRVEELLPVHRLKWCCILLNEFRTDDHQRRLHAGLSSENLLEKQFVKSEQYFSQHLIHLA